MSRSRVRIFIFLSISLILMLGIIGCSSNQSSSSNSSNQPDSTTDNKSDVKNDEVIEWNLSMWGGPRGTTYPAEHWAEAMKEATDGRWIINLHYGEALSPATDNLDGLQNGLFEAALITPFYTPGRLPLNQVIDLPFIHPMENKELIEFQMAAWEHPAILKELEDNNVVPLLPLLGPQFEYMGTKPLTKAEDFKGLRVAGMSPEMGQVFEEFGAVPTLMPAPELYNALEKGMLDGVTISYSFVYESYKLHEVSKYNTVGLAAGSTAIFYLANKDAWDALPEEFKEAHWEYYKNSPEIFTKPFDEADEVNIPMFKEELEFVEFPAEERQKLIDKASVVWDEWVEQWKDRGPTREVLDYMIEKEKEISGR